MSDRALGNRHLTGASRCRVGLVARLIGACSLLVLAGLLAAPARSDGALASDQWITTRIKMLLLLSPEVNGMHLHVDTQDGRVTLYGTVASPAERASAERIAQQIIGVRSVRNLIAVVPENEKPAMQLTDHTLEENVGIALRDDPVLASSDIHVASVDAGTVVLGGRAKSLSEPAPRPVGRARRGGCATGCQRRRKSAAARRCRAAGRRRGRSGAARPGTRQLAHGSREGAAAGR